MDEQKRYCLITCAVLHRECYYCAARCQNIIDVRLVDQGLHDIGEAKMSAKLQEQIDAVECKNFDAILLGYGLCNNGIRGLHAPIPLVIPRAHDCITLLMGSKEKYRDYFNANPGTYYYSVGWAEQSKHHAINPEATTSQMGLNQSYSDLVEIYGEENAAEFMEMLGGGLKHYDKLLWIENETGDFPECRTKAINFANEYGWKFEQIKGSISLILKMVNGEWNDDEFLVIQPGKTIRPTHDNSIIEDV